MKIEKERGPRGRLMLADTGNDRNVNLGIARIPERVETAGPWSNVAGVGQEDDAGKDQAGSADDGNEEELAELALGQLALHISDESVRLQKSKRSSCGHVLAGSNGLESNERDLHGHDGAKYVEYRVG